MAATSPIETPDTPPALDTAGFSGDELGALADALILPRTIEERMLLLLRQGRLGKWFSGIGQEAVAVGVGFALRRDDWILPLHRNLGVFTTRGVDLDRLLHQVFGRARGFTGGRDRTFHFGDLPSRIVGMISHLGAMLPVAAGLGLASQLDGELDVTAAFIGDGGSSEGDFHEAVNLAAVWKLPVIFVVENNGWGLSTPVAEQFACRHLASRAEGYGIPGEVVDGNDVLAVVRAVRGAASRARAGGGPTLLEFETYRMRGHEEASGIAYVPPEELTAWAGRDPLRRYRATLETLGVLSPGEWEHRQERTLRMVVPLIERALAGSAPATTPEAEEADVWAPPLPAPRRIGTPGAPPPEMRDMRYLEAIREGLREALAAIPEVVLIGQDIAAYGGAFKATEGLAEEFGIERVRNTPIIESGALGAALGLALAGYRPCVEMQFGDFITCGFNQIVNNLATTRYRWGAGVPVVIRAPIGGGLGAGPFHSQNVEAFFGNVPGLKIVAPATAVDAKGLLLAAFCDGNPVLFLEHKALYRAVRGPTAAGWEPVPIGAAAVTRAGRDATVVTYGAGVHWAMAAARELSTQGAEVEVIDLRSLRPWDRATVLASVERTGRALVLHEAPVTGGFGAEVAATISTEAFMNLDAPVVRLGALDTPVPAGKELEDVHSPRRRLLPELRRLLAY